jgi:hypothetical protein
MHSPASVVRVVVALYQESIDDAPVRRGDEADVDCHRIAGRHEARFESFQPLHEIPSGHLRGLLYRPPMGLPNGGQRISSSTRKRGRGVNLQQLSVMRHTSKAFEMCCRIHWDKTLA